MYLQQNRVGRSWVPTENDWLADRLRLGGSYYDLARRTEIEYGVGGTPISFGISYVAGIISGLLGIGGGGVKVPAINAISEMATPGPV